MHPAFLGVMAGKIFLWVQAQAIRRKDDDNDHSRYRPQRGLLGREDKKIKKEKPRHRVTVIVICV